MNVVEVYEWLVHNKAKVINALGDKSVQELVELFNSTGASNCDEAFSLLRPAIRLFHIPEQRFTRNYDNSCSTGCLLKTDFTEDNKHIYLKLSHKGSYTYGKESLCEVIASRIGQQLAFNVLPYYPCLVDLENGSGPFLGCYSYDYANNYEIYTAIDICESHTGPYSTGLKQLQSIGFGNEMNDIIIFDYLIGNTDRHARNIEFLGGARLKAAPIFDNGKSLLVTFAMYPLTWDTDQITNNFLTHNHTFNTFKFATPKRLPAITCIDWITIFTDIKDYITESEQESIISYITHNYKELQKRGIIYD